MILHLGDDIAVHTRDVVAIIDLTRERNAITGAMLSEVRRQNRILAKQGITAKSAVICAGARKPGGATENPRVYLSPISSTTLAQRAHEQSLPMEKELAALIEEAGKASTVDDPEIEARAAEPRRRAYGESV